MAITFVNAGTAATALSGNVTPTLPSGWAADDIHIILVHSFDNVSHTFPAGWTIIDERNNGANQRVTCAWRRAVGGDGNPTVTHSAGNSIIANIGGFRGCSTGASVINANGSQANASSATVTAPDISPTVANCMIVFLGASSGSGSTFSSYSGTNPTFTEGFDNTYSGEDDSICLAYGIKTDTGSTGSRTATQTVASVNVGTLIALLEAGAGAPTGVDRYAASLHLTHIAA